jgi:hypothetical protein
MMLALDRAWLSACRGAGVRPGGVFWQRPDALPLDTAWRRDLFRERAESVLLPVAGNGCGNCHVLAPDGSASFVDT